MARDLTSTSNMKSLMLVIMLQHSNLTNTLAGKGAYGLVVACRDTRQPNDEGLIAVKKIEKAFEHRIFTKRTLRELKIMRLCNHENVKRPDHLLIKLFSKIIGCDLLQLPKSRRHFKEVYVYTELMETDLAVILKSP